MDGGVALALRGERDFRDAREAREVGLGHAELARRDHQGAFGRIALHAPAASSLLTSAAVVGERRRPQRSRDRLADAG